MELKQWFACLKKGNTPHGVLLAGPEGSGKKDYARQAAALYLKGTAEPEALTDCPYFREMEDTSIETLRDCCAELNQQAFGRGRRCLLLPDAHLLDMRTQNTLLKTLEEPPEEALLVWLQVYPFADIKGLTQPELTKTIAALWPDIKALTLAEPIEVSTEPDERAQGILSKLLSAARPEHLKVAFIYAFDPKVSAWTRAH